MFNGQLVLLCFGCFLFFDRSFVLQFSIRYRSFFQFIFVSVSKLFILTLSHLIWMMTIANCLCSSRPFCSFRSNNYTSAFYFSLFFAFQQIVNHFILICCYLFEAICNSLHAIQRTISIDDFVLFESKLLEWLDSITQYYLQYHFICMEFYMSGYFLFHLWFYWFSIAMQLRNRKKNIYIGRISGNFQVSTCEFCTIFFIISLSIWLIEWIFTICQIARNNSVFW